MSITSSNTEMMQKSRLRRLADDGAMVMEWQYDQAADVMPAHEVAAAIRGVHAIAQQCAEDLGDDATASAVASAVKAKSSAAARFQSSHGRIFERLVDPASREDAYGRLLHLCAAKAALERGEYPSYEAATAAVSQYLLSEATDKMESDGRLPSA